MSVVVNLRKNQSEKRVVKKVKVDFELNPKKYRFPKSGKLPLKLIFFDVETKQAKVEGNLIYHEAFLIVAQYYKRINGDYCLVNTYKFTNKKDFTRWLVNKAPAVVFAHNISFDFRAGVDLEIIEASGFKLTFLNFEKGRTIIRLKNGKGTLTFVDTMNYYNFSVEQIGKTFGLEKLKPPENYDDENGWFEYCKRDVEIIAKATIFLIKFMSEFKIGLKYTIPAYAFAVFNKHFKDKKVFFAPTDDERINELERAAYYGGRVEAYRLGEIENVMIVDFNSMYPAVMRDAEIPVKPLLYIQNPGKLEAEHYIMNYACIARVEVDVPENVDPPPFPFRDQNTGKLIFPVGKFETVLAHPELRKGWKYIIKVKELVVYETRKVFEKYVDYFYNKRIEAKQKNDKVHDLVYKLLLNSLYGKFAEVTVEGEEYFLCPKEKREKIFLSKRGYKVIITPPLGKIVYREKKEKTRFTAVSAAITSYARVKLLEAIEKAGIENVVYCDTDSLFLINPVEVKEKLKDELDGSTLGKLKVESIEKKVTILLPKVYKTDTTIKIKGVPKRAVEDLTRKYRFERVIGPLEQLKRKIEWGVVWEIDEKKIEAYYDKRIVLEDNSTKPIRLGTIEKFIY